MIYLDANVFIYAAVSEKTRGERCRSLIKGISEGKENAATSALTFDEVLWRVKKERGKDAALLVGKAMLEMPNLTLLDVTGEILWEAYRLIRDYGLDPRDGIHAACCLKAGATKMISEDSDFDKVREIKREWLF